MHPLIENLQTLLLRVPFSREQIEIIRGRVTNGAIGADPEIMKRIEHILGAATRNSVGKPSVGNDARVFVAVACMALFATSFPKMGMVMESKNPDQANDLFRSLMRGVFGINTFSLGTYVFPERLEDMVRPALFYEYAAGGARPNIAQAKAHGSRLTSRM